MGCSLTLTHIICSPPWKLELLRRLRLGDRPGGKHGSGRHRHRAISGGGSSSGSGLRALY